MQKSEIFSIIGAILIVTLVMGYGSFTINSFIYSFVMSLILFTVYITTQKIVANQLGISINFKLWTFRRYWLRWQDYLKWDFPIGIVLPLLFSIVSNGFLKWTAILSFEEKTKAKKVTKRFSEINEFDLALIASSGVFISLLLALTVRILGFGDFASIISWFAMLNMIPIGNMNGTKIFFGARYLWFFLVTFTILVLILINLAHVVATIFVALIIAAIAAVIFYYFYEK